MEPEVGSGWKIVLGFDQNVRELEEQILNLIGESGPGLEEKVMELRGMILFNKEFGRDSFRDYVAYDMAVLLDLVERGFLDSDGR